MKTLGIIMTVLVCLLISVSGLHSAPTIAAIAESHPWDVNGDGLVDFADLMFVGKHIGEKSATAADVNGDGLVNIADLILVGVHFGEEYEPVDKENIGKDGAPMVLIPAGE
jgi:hypothetical protein